MNPLYVVDEPLNVNSGLSNLIFFILHDDDEIYPNNYLVELLIFNFHYLLLRFLQY